MYPAKVYTTVIYNERLRQAENGRLARAQKRDQPRTEIQLRRRGRIRALILRIVPRRAQA
jgi:hypothetical protein